MPITFADCADPMLRVPTMQGTVTAALLTLGLVPPAADASRGALWRAVSLHGWDGALGGERLVRVRRIGLKARGRRGDGSLMIGVALEGAHWRIACEAVAEPEQAGLGALLRELAASSRAPCPLGAPLFRAACVAASAWAAGMPRPGLRGRPLDTPTAPPRPGAPS